MISRLRPLLFAALAATLALPLHARAADPSPAERRAVLDALRPVVAAHVGAPVKLVVQRLGVAEGWAIFEGDPVAPDGKPLDWSHSAERAYCSGETVGPGPTFAILHRRGDGWRVEQFETCPEEPPYWEPERLHLEDRPCALFEDLSDSKGQSIAELCRTAHARRARRHA